MLNERELKILEIVAEADEPVGSWYIVNKFTESGSTVSSATIGRCLNSLEQQGYLKKHGIKGRTITREGREVVSTTYREQTMATHRESLDKLINSKVLNNFLMVLEARKGIEKTISRLAAQHITGEELEKLELILKDQQTAYQEKKSAAKHDIEFHRTIALASRNEVLYALYMMLSTMGQQTELFEELRHHMHNPYMGSHWAIYQALKEHEPNKAEQSMEEHINRLCSDVNMYWHEFAENKKITVPG